MATAQLQRGAQEQHGAKPLFSYRKYWAQRFGVAPFLPMSRAEMEALGWDSCDVVLVTGDAYIDHPSFGMAIVGRLLEAQGFRVGIIAQPDWRSAEPFKALGKPNLFFGVTSGNMDSMVNRYTSDRRLRHNDSYTPGGEGGRRPDRAVIVYAQRCREAFPQAPIVLGGIEASLRRIAHYDYWSDKVRRSILADAKADLLLYGNAERALVEVAHRIARGGLDQDFSDIRGLAFLREKTPEGWTEAPVDDLDAPDEGRRRKDETNVVIRLPSFDQVVGDPESYARASRVLHRESNPGNARPLTQRHGDRDVWLTAPPIPLTTPEMDAVYGAPYQRKPHPSYGEAKIPAQSTANRLNGSWIAATLSNKLVRISGDNASPQSKRASRSSSSAVDCCGEIKVGRSTVVPGISLRTSASANCQRGNKLLSQSALWSG